jgi:1-acyl-sn-glycerol-3-phosphate acyltransferase
MKFMEKLDLVLYIIVHNFFKSIFWLWLRVVHFASVKGASNVPKKGGFIAAANHASFWDPPFVGVGTWRRMFRFMARDTLFKFPIATALRYMGAIPIKRAAVDRGAWDRVIQTVKDGHIVGLFPEGTRTPDGEIHDGKPGTGMLVYKSHCRVIPIYIHGGYRVWKKGTLLAVPFRKLTMVYGEPMSFDEEFNKEESKAVYIEITQKIMARIRQMRDEYVKGTEPAKK